MEREHVSHLLSVDKNIWVAVTKWRFIPKGDDDVVKHPKDWIDDETKNTLYDLKVRNIYLFKCESIILNFTSQEC